MSPDDASVVVALVTGPDKDTLGSIGRAVVQDRLAACTNVLGGVSSVYRWKGRVELDEEALAIMKTTSDRVDDLRNAVIRLHPYEEPEFIVLPVIAGSPGYLDWVVGSVGGDPEE